MNKKRLVVLSCILAALLSGCAGIAQKELPSEQVPRTTVLFCSRDDCERAFVDLASRASEIKCAFYELNSEKMQAVLDEKTALLVLDDKNDTHQMHNKFCIFDAGVVWTGSWNPKDGKQSANNVVIIRSKYIAGNYADEFSELQRGVVYGKKVRAPQVLLNSNLVENYFCPDDECQKHVLDALETAESSIYFMTFSFTDDDIGSLLLEKSKSIKVAGLFDKSQNSKWSEYERLKAFSQKITGLHHKVFIVDKETVITGSYNPSRNGNENNDENLLIIHDPVLAESFVEEFLILSGRAS